MQAENATSIEYFRDLRRVADLLNGVIFQGEQVISPENLKEKNPVIHNISRKNGNINAIENTLDLSITVTFGRAEFLLMLQGQTCEHYAMPVRVLHERGTDYYNQWKNIRKKHKENRDLKHREELLSGIKRIDTFCPVLHMVIYFGRNKWTAAKSMDELIPQNIFPKELQRLFKGEKSVLVFEVRHFQDTQRFHTDLRQVCEFLQKTEDKTELEKYVRENKSIFAQLPEDTYDLLTAMSGIKQMALMKDTIRTEKGGLDMCKAFDDMQAEWELKGERRGELRGERRGKREGRREGRRKGRREGEDSMGKLWQILFPAGRYEDLMLASTDRRYIRELMKELGIN